MNLPLVCLRLPAASFCRGIDNLQYEIEIHRIEHLDWPEATLFRYKIFDKFKDQLQEPILMHIDADSLFTPNFESKFKDIRSLSDINFVMHPGYFRTKKYRPWINANKLVIFLKDLIKGDTPI